MAYYKKNSNKKVEGRARRHARIRSHMSGTSEMPRLSVFKSNRYIYAQVIDDNKGETIVSASSLGEKKGTMIEKAIKVGEAISKLAKEKKVEKVVFDRGGFYFAGHIKALAESARKGGLKF